MNKNKLIIAGLSSVFCLSLVSCEINTKGYFDKAEGFENCRKAFNKCFEKTFNHKNMTICYHDVDKLRWTERILGDTSNFVIEQEVTSEDRGTFYTTITRGWCFLNEKGEKIYAQEDTPWSDGARYITQYYFRDDSEYDASYKYFKRYFDVINKLEEWIEPFTSTSEGKEQYEQTITRWGRYHCSSEEAARPQATDTYLYDVNSQIRADDSDIFVSSYGQIDPKTELVTMASIAINLPNQCGPNNGAFTWGDFKMTYDDVSEINIPDISGWEDMSNK